MDILAKAKEVFDEIFENIKLNTEIPRRDDINIYRKAVVMERNSYKFYKEKAEKLENEVIKKSFLELAREERRHEMIMTI